MIYLKKLSLTSKKPVEKLVTILETLIQINIASKKSFLKYIYSLLYLI